MNLNHTPHVPELLARYENQSIEHRRRLNFVVVISEQCT